MDLGFWFQLVGGDIEETHEDVTFMAVVCPVGITNASIPNGKPSGNAWLLGHFFEL